MEKFQSKRRTRMMQYLNDNPYVVYGDYRDVLPDRLAELIIAGEFDTFREEWWEIELETYDYIDWSFWESEFADAFGYENFEQVPERIKDILFDSRWVDFSGLLRTCLRNWRGNVCARPVKRSGEYIEFPCGWDPQPNAGYLARYLKDHCGIDDPWQNEAGYQDTYLTVLGTLDLEEILESGKKPTHIIISSDDFTLGACTWNGSGTCANDQYKGRTRKIAAEIFIDGTRGYGVQETYGLVGPCWANEIKVA
ncbi:MAG: hypothetical protein JJ891_06795 [Rhizobiaceae bacterium]|nr:hypothetical protein [Rhizobiaceae bacterium]